MEQIFYLEGPISLPEKFYEMFVFTEDNLPTNILKIQVILLYLEDNFPSIYSKIFNYYDQNLNRLEDIVNDGDLKKACIKVQKMLSNFEYYFYHNRTLRYQELLKKINQTQEVAKSVGYRLLRVTRQNEKNPENKEEFQDLPELTQKVIKIYYEYHNSLEATNKIRHILHLSSSTVKQIYLQNLKYFDDFFPQIFCEIVTGDLLFFTYLYENTFFKQIMAQYNQKEQIVLNLALKQLTKAKTSRQVSEFLVEATIGSKCKEWIEKINAYKKSQNSLSFCSMEKLNTFFKEIPYETFITDYQSYMGNIDYSEIELLQRYFVSLASKEEIDDYQVEKEINLALLGFQKNYFLSKKRLYEAYQENKDQFTVSHQQFLEQNYFFDEKQLTSLEKSRLLFLLTKLEKIYFHLDNIMNMEVPKEVIIEVLQQRETFFTEEQKEYLTSYYGIGCQAESYLELAKRKQKSYDEVHDLICYLKEKALFFKYHIVNSTTVEIENERYFPYLKDLRYEMTEQARYVTSQFIIHHHTYQEIHQETGLKLNIISNMITDTIRRMDFWRYGIVNPEFLPRDQVIAVLEKIDTFSNLEKQFLYERYVDHQSVKKLKEKFAFSWYTSETLSKCFLEKYCDFSIPNDQELITLLKKEQNLPVTDTIFNQEEQEKLTLFLSQIEESLDFSKYSKKQLKQIKEMITKVKLKKLGMLRPSFGHISCNEMENILQDPHLPLSDKEKDLLYVLKTTTNPSSILDQLAQKYQDTPDSIYRRYLRAILKIRQYQNNEIEEVISYETDVVPNLKYFSQFDRKILKFLYQDNYSTSQIGKQLLLSPDKTRTIMLRVKKQFMLILKEASFVTKFDFDYFKEVFNKKDFPFYGDKDQALSIFKMYFGDNGTLRLTIPEIIQKLNLPFEKTAVLNLIDTILLATEKYKLGLRKEKRFSDDTLKTFFEQNQGLLDRSEKLKFLRYFANSRPLLNKKGNFDRYELEYTVLKYSENLPFSLETVEVEQIESILKKKEGTLSLKTKRGMMQKMKQKKDLLKPSQERMILNLLSPIYLYEREKQYSEKQYVFTPTKNKF